MMGTDDKKNYGTGSQLLKYGKSDAEPMEVLMMTHNVIGKIQKTSKYISYVSFQTYLNGGKIVTSIFFVVIV